MKFAMRSCQRILAGSTLPRARTKSAAPRESSRGAGITQMASSDEHSDYEVGYKKPPVHTRFQKGKSGNPRGRPKGSANYLTLLRRVLAQKVTISDGGNTRKIPK